MKVLFATTNPAKVKRYVAALEKRGIQVITINDLDKQVEVIENGRTALENAYIKAKAYYDATHITTIATDDNLFIEELPEEKQPGANVRRINGKRLTDDEMIEYYTGLVKEYGERLTAKWVYGMVIYNGKEKKEYTWSKSHFYFVAQPSEKRNPGYPLDSISVSPEHDKYFVDLSEQEKRNPENESEKDKMLEFVIENI